MGQRSKTDWLGRERLTARMTGASPGQAAAAIAAAQKSWDADLLIHIYKASALTDLEADGLAEVIDGILRVGWSLHSTAMGVRTVGPNAQQALFVFTRPVAQP